MRKTVIVWWIGVFIVFIFPFLYGRFVAYSAEWNISFSYLFEFWFWGIHFTLIGMFLMLIGAAGTEFKKSLNRMIAWGVPIAMIGYYSWFFVSCSLQELGCS